MVRISNKELGAVIRYMDERFPNTRWVLEMDAKDHHGWVFNGYGNKIGFYDCPTPKMAIVGEERKMYVLYPGGAEKLGALDLLTQMAFKPSEAVRPAEVCHQQPAEASRPAFF